MAQAALSHARPQARNRSLPRHVSTVPMPIAIPDLVGYVAGFLSASSFVPQLLKAWREPDPSAISARTYLAAVTAFALWIVYGVLIGSWPIMIFNVASLALSGAILVLRLRKARAAHGTHQGGTP